LLHFKTRTPQINWDRKSKPNFGRFDTLKIIRGGVGERSESIFTSSAYIRPNFSCTFDNSLLGRVRDRSVSLVVKKARQQNLKPVTYIRLWMHVLDMPLLAHDRLKTRHISAAIVAVFLAAVLGCTRWNLLICINYFCGVCLVLKTIGKQKK